MLGKVDISGPQDPGKAGRIVVRDPSSAGDEVLDAALQRLAAQPGKKPYAVIWPLGKNLRPALYQRLAASGVLRREKPDPGHLPEHRRDDPAPATFMIVKTF